MFISIIIFYISIIGIATMILLKRREVITGRPCCTAKLGARWDKFFDSMAKFAKNAVSQCNRQTAIAIVQIIAYHVLLHARKVYVEIKHRALRNPHGKKVIDAVRGRGQVSNHGSSFYLRRIADNK